MSRRFEKFPPQILEGVCRVIGEIGGEMSGTQINKYLQDCGIDNPTPEITKWQRLYNAFHQKQHYAGVSNDILNFIQKALHPSRFLNSSDKFNGILQSLNKPLSFMGLEYCQDAKSRPVTISKTIDDAQKRANTLISKLQSREVHEDIYKFCKAELLVENYFHAVFETTKGVADRIRDLSNMSADGAELVDLVFTAKSPVLIINNFTTETDISEHKGFSNLLKGFFGMFRNTTAHSPKIQWAMTEQDALEIMTIASLCHRKLDKAHKIR